MTTISEFSAPRPAQILGGGLASLGTGGAASSSLYTPAATTYVDSGLSRTIGSSFCPQVISSPQTGVRTFGTSITREVTSLSNYIAGSQVAQPLLSGSYVPTGSYVASGSYVPLGGYSLGGTKGVYSSSSPVSTGMIRNASSIGTVTSPMLLGSSTPIASVGSCVGGQSYETIVHPPVEVSPSYFASRSAAATQPLDGVYSTLSPSPLSGTTIGASPYVASASYDVVQGTTLGTSPYVASASYDVFQGTTIGTSPYVASASYVPISSGLSSGLTTGFSSELVNGNAVVSTRPISREEMLGTGHLITGEEAAQAGTTQRLPAAMRADGRPAATVVADARPLSYAGQPQPVSTSYAGTGAAYGTQSVLADYGVQPAYDAYATHPEVYEAVEYVQPVAGETAAAQDMYGSALVQDPYGGQPMMYDNQPAEQYMDGGIPVSYPYDEQPQEYMDDQGEQQGEPYTVLPVPDEYMQLLNNLQEIMEQTGCRIEAAEPPPGTGEWEVSLFGSPEARGRAHEMIETTIAAELTRAEGGEYYDNS